MLCQLGPRGASSDAGAQRTTRDKYDASVGCSAAKGPGRLRDDRLFSSDDITILVHGKWGFATTGLHSPLLGEGDSRTHVPVTNPADITVKKDPLNSRARSVGWLAQFGVGFREQARGDGK